MFSAIGHAEHIKNAGYWITYKIFREVVHRVHEAGVVANLSSQCRKGVRSSLPWL